MKRKKKYLYAFNSSGEVIFSKRITLTKDRYVKETGIPVEDYGDYLLSDDPVNNPFEEWSNSKPVYENSAAEDYIDYLHSRY